MRRLLVTVNSDTPGRRQLDAGTGMRERSVCLLLTLVVVACGCSKNGRTTYPAGGTVTLDDGSPLPGGWIEFQLEGEHTAPTAKALIQPDGTFELGTYTETDGALAGSHRVMVMPPFPKLNMRWEPGDTRGPPAAAQDIPKIELRYQRFETSGLKFDVTAEPSENRFEIRVEKRK